jgi:hypothetical protein
MSFNPCVLKPDHNKNVKAIEDLTLDTICDLVAEQEERFHVPSSLCIFACVNVYLRNAESAKEVEPEYAVKQVLPMLHATLDLGKEGKVALGKLAEPLGSSLKDFFICYKCG